MNENREEEIENFFMYGTLITKKDISQIINEEIFFESFLKKFDVLKNQNPIMYWQYKEAISNYLNNFDKNFHLSWLKDAKCNIQNSFINYENNLKYPILRLEVISDLINIYK